MDLYECPVCLSNMLKRSPRFLQCHHTFCSECLEALLNNKTILCPKCREITKLKSDDITELKINFLLHEVKDRETKAATVAPPEEPQPKPLCQICKKKDPVFFCTSCPRAMCTECKDKHNKVSSLKSHTVCDLCKLHQDGVTHLCKLCVRPLCMQCMLLEHMEHESHFLTYNQGVQELQEKVKTMQGDINTETTDKEESLQENLNVEEHINAIIHKLEETEAFHEAKAKETRKYIREAKLKLTQYSNLHKDFSKLKTECSVANASLNSLVTSTAEFCERYPKLMEKAQQALDQMKSLSVEDLLPPFEPAEPCICDIVRPRQPKIEEIRDLKLSELVLHKEQSNEIYCYKQGALLGNDVLFVNKKNHVIRLNQEGTVVDRYYPADGGNVCGVSVYNNKIYIAQPKAVTLIVPKNSYPIAVYKPKVDCIDRILVKDENTIFIANYRTKKDGKIYMYNVKQDKTNVMVQGLDEPHYINMMQSDEGIRYIVTAFDMHRIYIYNEQWQLVHSFGRRGGNNGQLSGTNATAVTRMNTLLIADCHNLRVCHFTVDGRFLSNVITANDGLKVMNYPTAIVYKKPLLWVANGYVKCFKLE